MKVHELAKELGVDNTDVLRAVKRMGISEVTHHFHSVNDDTLDLLKETIASMPEKEEPTTKPWNADDNPWKVDLLNVKRRRKGYRPHWAPRGDIQKMLDQGWKIAERKHYGGAAAQVTGEESEDESIVRRRELILMEMPEELALQRDDFYKRKTELRSTSARDIATQQAKRVEAETGDSVQLKASHTTRQGY